VLGTVKLIAIIGSMAEGSSIRSIERLSGVHRDTIMRSGVRVGRGCMLLMDEKMRDLDCHRLEMDEIWGFVGKKERHVRPGDDSQFATSGHFAPSTPIQNWSLAGCGKNHDDRKLRFH